MYLYIAELTKLTFTKKLLNFCGIIMTTKKPLIKSYVAAIENDPIVLSRESMRNICKTKLEVILERRRDSVTARLRRFINGRE